MGTSGWTNEDNEITIPADAAGTDRPRIVITGGVVPGGYPVDAAILFYWNRTDYWYIGISRFGDAGFFTRGFVSEVSGDADHVEEIAYGPTGGGARSVYWERFVARYVSPFGQVIETIDADGLRQSLSNGTIQRIASDYQDAQGGSSLVSQSQGMMDIGGFSATAGITGETVVMSLVENAGDFVLGRRYRVEFMGRVTSTVAGDRARFRLRQTNAAGTIEAEFGEVTIPSGSVPVPFNGWCLYTGRGVVGETVVLTVERTAGAGTLTYAPIESAVSDAAPTSLG